MTLNESRVEKTIEITKQAVEHEQNLYTKLAERFLVGDICK